MVDGEDVLGGWFDLRPSYTFPKREADDRLTALTRYAKQARHGHWARLHVISPRQAVLRLVSCRAV